ncbi:sulfonate transport system permease protein [Humitalea rosea]|uniref:Sulfonate transport system permease protein n=1 Tax=Humitalea rosea TaxID=990373 RepID=A0A2W7ISJ9_9PROT|nr:ABC transporter permease [Humitalea rosea]PZW50826.1 sulfonate transport system permease protein [Humitalea rosea]
MSVSITLPRAAAGPRAWRLPAWPAALLLPLLGLLAWAAAARAGWLTPAILPAPAEVWATLTELWQSGELQSHALWSMGRVVQGFAIGAVLGLALGAAMALSPRVEDYLRPSFVAIAQVPVIGWVPLLMLPLGIGEALKIVIIAKAALVPVTLNTLAGIRAVPRGWVEVGTAFRYSRWQVLRHVVLPAAVPPVFTGIRYGLTSCWKALVAVELLASAEGLGFLLVWGRQMFQMDMVIAGMVVIAAVGLVFDASLALLERRLQPWRAA